MTSGILGEVWIRLLADAVMALHFAFVVFVGCGGLLVLRDLRWSVLHVPAALWGACISFFGWICPLTPLEIELRRRAGEAGYDGGFIDHYLAAIVYPDGLTRETQLALGAAVVVVNGVVYAFAIARHRRRVTMRRPLA